MDTGKPRQAYTVEPIESPLPRDTPTDEKLEENATKTADPSEVPAHS